jgi:peptidoglycan/LPS O-acetylase OafA/YrhL
VIGVQDLQTQLTRPSARRLGWSPSLDGVRGVGVVLVMSFHFLGGRYMEGGPILVDLFFVLSGFLITTLLLEERAAAGSVSMRNFYLRRAFRLFPALYALLAVFLVYALAFGGADRNQLLVEFFAAAFYVYDILVALTGIEGKVLAHLWTLSLEEQFYILWPLLLLGALRAARRIRLEWLLAAMLAIVVVFPIIRITIPTPLGQGTWQSVLFGFAILRPDSLVIGCAAALIWWIRPDQLSEQTQRFARIAGNVALGMLLLNLALGGFAAFAPFVSVFFNLTIIALPFWVIDLVRRPDTAVAQQLARPLAVWFGKRSYSLYMWHNLINFIVAAGFADLMPTQARLAVLASFPVKFALTVGICELSWRFIETPALRLKQRFARAT